MTIFSKHLGGMAPLTPPDYAYDCSVRSYCYGGWFL